MGDKETITNRVIPQRTLGNKIKALRVVWGNKDIDAALLWCWRYAETESSYLQLHDDCDDKEYERRLALVARIRTENSIDELLETTKCLKKSISAVLGYDVNYIELRKAMAENGGGMKLLLTDNYEALIHERYNRGGQIAQSQDLERMF
jgi:hypothetical protein